MSDRFFVIVATRLSLANPTKSTSELRFITSSKAEEQSEFNQKRFVCEHVSCVFCSYDGGLTTFGPVQGERVSGDDGAAGEMCGEARVRGVRAPGDDQQGEQPPAGPLQQLAVALSQPRVGQ